MDQSIKQIQALHLSLISDPVVQYYMKKQYATGYLNRIDQNNLSRKINQIEPNLGIIKSILPMTLSGKVLDNLYSLPEYRFLLNADYREFMSTHAFGVFSSPNTFPVDVLNPTFSEKNTITYFGEYLDATDYADIGSFAINIDHNSLFESIGGLCKTTFDDTYIVNENNKPVYLQGDPSLFNLLSPMQESNGYDKVAINGRTYLIFSTSIKQYPRWRILGLVRYSDLMSKVNNLLTRVTVFSILAMLLVIGISQFISKQITKPIRAIRMAMLQLENHLRPNKVYDSSANEMDQLVTGFNNMVDSIKRLTDETTAQKALIKERDLALIRFRLDLLQSQINSHFIHNTLNTINYMAMKAGNEDISKVTMDFELLLRASISTNISFSTVYEEIQYIKSYINIQKYHYDEPIHLHCEIGKDTEMAQLPKLVLQPLVENAVFHGILPRHGGQIRIMVEKIGDELRVTIADDGLGMPDSILNNEHPSTTSYSKISLKNVNNRLVLYYGEGSALKIRSVKDRGCTIEFNIPYSV